MEKNNKLLAEVRYRNGELISVEGTAYRAVGNLYELCTEYERWVNQQFPKEKIVRIHYLRFDIYSKETATITALAPSSAPATAKTAPAPAPAPVEVIDDVNIVPLFVDDEW